MLRLAGEPSLTEILAEPIVRALMESDSVEPRELCRLLQDARVNRRGTARRDTDA